MKNSRDFAYELIERTYESNESMLRSCLAYMSTDQVSDMLLSNFGIDCFTEDYLKEYGINKNE